MTSKYKIAVFTNQFPGKVNTFFVRDVFSLLNNSYEIDIFPIYPIQPKNWLLVPEQNGKIIIERTKTIHISPFTFLPVDYYKNNRQEIIQVLRESLNCGIAQLFKSHYVICQAILWAKKFDGQYDQMISYWGNFAGTYGYFANKIIKNKIPFTLILHAGTDLYRDRIHLEEKMLYADEVITVCEFNRHFLKENYPKTYEVINKKLTVYHLGLDFENFKFNIESRDLNTILVIGSFYKQKGFLYSIEAFAQVAEKNKELRLVMIGEGPEKKAYLSQIKKLGLIDCVDFPGWLPFEEVKKYLLKCTILVHPSSDYGDAVPTVIKEAMASGLPVIGSDIVGIPELLDYGNCGILVPPKDINALAQAMKDLLSSPEQRIELAKKARSFAEEKFSKRLVDYF